MIPLVILFAIFAFVFLILAEYMESLVLSYLGSLMFILLGIYTMAYGLLDINDWFTRGIAFLFLSIGFYVTIKSSYGMINDN